MFFLFAAIVLPIYCLDFFKNMGHDWIDFSNDFDAMRRHIDEELTDWKKEPRRNVLLVRGARQVGKTYSIRQLGATFEYFLEVNFEKVTDIHTFFDGSLDPIPINEKLSTYFKIPIIPGKTLLFFDEIQACPNAIRALRFYHEDMPDLHVVAAGSMLEFALSEISSFGVGRISNLFMYPLSFAEFLWATGEERLEAIIAKGNPANPIDPTLHKILLEKFRINQVIGGMPAVVQVYLSQKDLYACQEALDELITILQDDFAKYKHRAPVIKLQEVFRSIAYQTGAKFKYASVAAGEAIYGYKEALELLVKAGLAYKIHHTDARGIPLGAQIDPKKFKVILFDLGIHQRLLGLSLSEQMIHNPKELIQKGGLAEVFVGLEWIARSPSRIRPQLFYWHRETRGSNAEVDYVIQREASIVPLEVKAGTKGQMQSLFLFLKERRLPYAVRFSHENFSRMEKIEVMPIYAVSKLFL